MSNKQALLNCTFSWGKICRLYDDAIEIAGRSYRLDDLTAIHPTYRTVFGVPSARLELSFGPRRFTLRGIPDLEIARQIVAHLLPYAKESNTQNISQRKRFRLLKARNLARTQAQLWERTTNTDGQREAQSQNPPTISIPHDQHIACVAPAQPETANLFDDFQDLAEQPVLLSLQPIRETPADVSQQPTLPVLTSVLLTPEQSSKHPATVLHLAPTQSIISHEDEAPPIPSTTEQSFQSSPHLSATKTWSMHIPRREPPLRSVQLVNTLPPSAEKPTERGLGTHSLPLPAHKSSVLPVIYVPVRLQPGECAHYSIGAALCGDRLAGAKYVSYPLLDQGLLILTNRRVFYLGKRCQLILAYTHLWYVSLLQNAIALHIEGQFRRIIMEIEHPQEWASRIEQLSFIARRTASRSPQTAPTFVLPGVKPSSAPPITVKRVALPFPTTRTATDSNIAQIIPPEKHTDQLARLTSEAQITARRLHSDQPTSKITPTAVPFPSEPKIEEMLTPKFPHPIEETLKTETPSADIQRTSISEALLHDVQEETVTSLSNDEDVEETTSKRVALASLEHPEQVSDDSQADATDKMKSIPLKRTFTPLCL